MTRVSAFLGVLSVFALFGVAPAHAADANFCDAYAKSAFQKAKQNNQFNCGFQGPRWVLDLNGHRIWCLVVPEATAQAETNARKAEMSGCICNWYADTAMAQVKENKQRNCGFSGLRWIESRQGHHDWCAKFNPGLPAMQGEISTRKAMLAQQC